MERSLPPPGIWGAFDRDPRATANQSLRAADADRDVITQVIADAYADGRLDQAEFDERHSRLAEAKLLGDLPPIVADLVPVDEAGPVAGDDAELQRRAVAQYADSRGQALMAMIWPSLICLVIWGWTSYAAGQLIFPWPLFVILGTGGNFARYLFGRDAIIEENRRKLLEQRAEESRGELPPPPRD